MNEFPTIKDKNIICTARLLFETPGPACRDTAARWCVSRYGVWSIQPFSQEIEIVASLQLCNLPHKGLNAALVKHVLVSLSRRFICFLLSLASLSKSIDWLDFGRVFSDIEVPYSLGLWLKQRNLTCSLINIYQSSTYPATISDMHPETKEKTRRPNRLVQSNGIWSHKLIHKTKRGRPTKSAAHRQVSH